jgi:hypothetical protein
MARLFEVEQAPLMPCNEDFKVDPDHKMWPIRIPDRVQTYL